MRLGGLDQFKNPITSLEFEPETFWLVAKCIDQLRYSVPPKALLVVGLFLVIT
jgi:hypothetical protein